MESAEEHQGNPPHNTEMVDSTPAQSKDEAKEIKENVEDRLQEYLPEAAVTTAAESPKVNVDDKSVSSDSVENDIKLKEEEQIQTSSLECSGKDDDQVKTDSLESCGKVEQIKSESLEGCSKDSSAEHVDSVQNEFSAQISSSTVPEERNAILGNSENSEDKNNDLQSGSGEAESTSMEVDKSTTTESSATTSSTVEPDKTQSNSVTSTSLSDTGASHDADKQFVEKGPESSVDKNETVTAPEQKAAEEVANKSEEKDSSTGEEKKNSCLTSEEKKDSCSTGEENKETNKSKKYSSSTNDEKKDSSSTTNEKKDSSCSTKDKNKDSSSTKDKKKDSSSTKDKKKDSSTKDKKKDSSSTKDERKDSSSSTKDKKKDSSSTKDEKKDSSSSTKNEKKDSSSVVDEDKQELVEPMEVESEKTTDVGKDSITTNAPQCNNVDQENSEDNGNENPVFVHVNTENEKEDGDKSRTEGDTQAIQDEEDFRNSQPQEDPIASDDFAPVQMVEETDETEQTVDEEQGSSEELCIIPDTERVISQEEKDAVASMVPLRDPTDAKSTDDTSKENVTEQAQTDSASEKYVISTCTDENVNACMLCCLPRKSKYSVVYNKKTSFICDDKCLNDVKDKYGDKVVLCSEGDLRVKNLTSGLDNDNMVSKVKFHRKCVDCAKKILNDEFNLSWETMEFCNEFCLSKYQKKIGANCANCQTEVRSNCLGKYCVRFGYDIRQFCSSACLEEYKKGLKVCSYCQKDMSGGGDGFLAPVGDKGQFKDFCTQQCMEKYDIMSKNREQPISKTGNTCSVCLNEKPITIEFDHDNKINLFCGEPCFVAFKFVNNITPGKCDMCRKYFDNKILEDHSMFYDNAQHSFCSKSCQNIYIIAHRKIVPCSWCRVKKYNFDMIRRNLCANPVLMMCSLNCLSLYQVSMNAVNSKKINCDHCHKSQQPLYHLTMSDATIRNFCSYVCVMAFQNQFSKTPITLNDPEDPTVPVPTGAPKRTKKIIQKNSDSDVPIMPVISNVQSLATTNGPSSINTRSTRSKNGGDPICLNTNSTPIIKTQIKQHLIVKPTHVPQQRNVATMCKVVSANKGINHKPTTVNKEVQTDDLQDRTAMIPIPVPIYVPSPVWMYSMPFPVPFPFPLPVPVPIFIPTTRNSATGIMKEIKKIQVKIPTDPFEAELLMMAEMVAGDKKEENTDSESEEEDTTAPADEGTFSPEPVDASNTFGDDMLQMALKMATELDEPAVDLEGALTANTITASQGGESTVGPEESVDDPQPIHHMMERQAAVRGRKRPGRPPKNTPSKRGRRSSNQMDMPLMAPPQPPAPPEPVEKPDANMCLKYTFGVNAWKQWVTTKNAELEKSSRRVKLFKPEILQLTADELNYSLCLFVKEVRKPNGQEYAPDTIYYLCLGIQQYLFENGRIDNIFCDAYYEKFTDCLDEVAKKFSVLYNDSHYIVTRVEEEHLWESKQLGAHSPHVLLSTLMFFNTKHFNLTTVDEHMQLSFSHIMKHWKRNPNQPGTNKVAGSRNVLLRFYPPQTATDSNTRKKKVYEQQENEDNPLRCPVKLYEFYLSKCPESVKTRNDVFYLLPERSCVPDSPVWYSTMPLPRNALEKMLHRVKMVKEINVALLTS